jgi:hypothetical protein
VRKREDLENMYKSGETQSGGMYSEDNQLPFNVEDVKFRGFENDMIKMEETSRHKTVSRFKRYEKAVEKEPVELGLSKLHTSMRKFSGGALNVFDVKRKSKSIKELRRVETLKNQDYLMSSLDEFFSVMDDVPAAASSQNVEPEYEKENYRTIKMISRVDMPKKKSGADISLDKAFGNKTEQKSDDQLKIISNYDIDENRSIYLVKVDGKSAIVAKSGENIFVLKRFNSSVDAPLQVRHDKDNTYIVKTSDFKSLVEVNNDRAGVLVEL